MNIAELKGLLRTCKSIKGMTQVFLSSQELQEVVLSTPISKSHQQWVEGHARKDKDGVWRCKETQGVILLRFIDRRVWWDTSRSKRRMLTVGHPYCPACQQVQQLPKRGASVNAQDLFIYEPRGSTS
ncbi:MAG: hypothetical protein HY435_03320 [Candidatus Liptonbacteria bacterium]|nr:hypothetical protein [Candidatus Liptonbacteria bacterium]